MFRKLLAYFLLFNFVNTMCFYELPATFQSGGSAAFVLEAAEDEIDSIAEFIAEVCFDLDKAFDETDSDDVPDHLKKASFKHFLPHDRLSFIPAFRGVAGSYKPYRATLTTSIVEVQGMPPEIFLS